MSIHGNRCSGSRTRSTQIIYIFLYFFCYKRWKNQLLTWKREEYDGINTIRINPSLVWIPDIVLYNRWVLILLRSFSVFVPGYELQCSGILVCDARAQICTHFVSVARFEVVIDINRIMNTNSCFSLTRWNGMLVYKTMAKCRSGFA